MNLNNFLMNHIRVNYLFFPFETESFKADFGVEKK